MLNTLYQLVNGTLVPIINNLVQGGGMAWNNDNTKFYLADSGAGVVYVYDINSLGQFGKYS